MIKLSVIICTYNRCRYLPAALESLKKQKANRGDYEIIIINNNSTDDTEKISLEFKKNNPGLNVKYEIEKIQGLSAARNKGIDVSEAPIVAFIDDDAVAREDYVENLIANFEKYTGYDAIGGKVIPIYQNGTEPVWMSKYIQRLVSKVDEGEKFKDFQNKYPVGCNMAFRKNVFNEIGKFNTDLTLRSDDKYIFSKLKKAGKKTLYAPDVYVRHNIEDFRIKHDFIKNLSKLNGHTERIRLKNEPYYFSVLKFFDYLIKINASFVIALTMIIRGHGQKAKYLIMVMCLSFAGFMYYKEK